MHLELLLPLFNIGLSLWVHAFLTSAHHFFRCCLGGGERRFGGFSFLDELTSGRYIFKRQLNPRLQSHTRFVCGRRSYNITWRGNFSDRSKGLINWNDARVSCLYPMFSSSFLFFSWVFGFCLLLRDSQCAHVILSSILVWPNKGQNKVQIVAVSRGLLMGVQL